MQFVIISSYKEINIYTFIYANNYGYFTRIITTIYQLHVYRYIYDSDVLLKTSYKTVIKKKKSHTNDNVRGYGE